jgi:hypothetical protein
MRVARHFLIISFGIGLLAAQVAAKPKPLQIYAVDVEG